jgi:ankyrin repeat protein
LQVASANGHANVVRLLLEKGANINALNTADENALHAAARNGKGNIVSLVLENGADVEAQNKYNNTAFQVGSVNSRHGTNSVTQLYR